MSALFSPISVRSVALRNRIVISPMCQYSSLNGEAQAWHMIHLGSLALSGAGMLMIEATAVEPDGRITPGDMGLYNDRTEAALRPVLAAIRKHSKIAVAIQLAHAGRKASCHVPWEGGEQLPLSNGGWRTHAPSALPQRPGEMPPLALDQLGLKRIRDAFAASARRSVALGLDGIEIHSAHGYLLHEFLSPISNQRDDAYGSSLENRMRFPLEVFEAVRASVPNEKPVGVRISASDWVDGGWDIAQSIAFAHELKSRGADWVDASSGGISPAQKVALGPGYQVPFAEAIKKATGITTMAVGLITHAQQAEDIIASGKADLIAMARGMLYDARWPWHAAADLGATVEAPEQYWRAPPPEHKTVFGDAAMRVR